MKGLATRCRSVEIVSHRGGALLWPENSLLAIENSMRLGVEQVQIDVHLSRDGRIVVIHDGTLERTAEGFGRIEDHDWSELSAIPLKQSGGQRIPSLEDAIGVIQDSAIVLRIEIKRDANGNPYTGLPASLGACLRAGGMSARTLLTSFSIDAVLAAAAHAPGARLGLLVNAAMLNRTGLAELIRTAAAHRIESLGLKWDALSPAPLSEIRAGGLKVGAFACNDKISIDRALSLGVDEIMTDRPDIALARRATAPKLRSA
jgi:glycerophosphoryl diester phosphodiesterase